MTKLAERLRELRLERNMSVRELAKALNVSAIAVSRWENNKRIPNADNICHISEYFKVSADYLLGIKDFQLPFGYIITKIFFLVNYLIMFL